MPVSSLRTPIIPRYIIPYLGPARSLDCTSYGGGYRVTGCGFEERDPSPSLYAVEHKGYLRPYICMYILRA